MHSTLYIVSALTLTLGLTPLLGCGDDSSTDGTGGRSSSSSSGQGGGGAGGSGGAGGGGGVGGAQPTIDCTGDTILHYEFGNQILRSSLDVSKTGAITHIEHDCCPPTDHPMDEGPVADLAALKAQIEAASHGTLHVEDGQPSSAGSMSGTLQACTSAKEGIILRDIARGAGMDESSPDIVTVNEAPEVQQIRDFVDAVVTQRMY